MGGNSRLSDDGAQFALDLADFIAAQSDTRRGNLSVWCSPMKRAVHTARAVRCWSLRVLFLCLVLIVCVRSCLAGVLFWEY